MMKTLNFTAKVLLAVFVSSSMFVSCYDDSSVLERLDKLEGTTIKSIEQQISAINTSIKSFQDVQTSMEKEIKANADGITDLKELYSELDKKVMDLKTYTDSAWKSTNDWVEKTFCTLEKFDSLTQVTAEIKELVISSTSELNEKIDTSITAVKNWTLIVLKAYYTSEEVDGRLNELKDSLEKFNSRLTDLENRFNALEKEYRKELDIVFDDNNISCLAGDVFSVKYTIKNGTANTKVYALGENGWKGVVKASTDTTGTIEVTVPSPYNDGVILVFLDGELNKTAVRALNFIQGSMTLSSDVVMADTEGDTLSVDIDTDLEYEISVPKDIDWIHFQGVTTRSAMRHEKATFVVDENLMAGSRSAVIDVNRKCGALLYQITIRQRGTTMQANEIWYTSTDGQVVEPTAANAFGSNIVSNTYGNKGVITFEDSVTHFRYQAFYGKERLKSISIPKGIQSIGESAFSGCSGLTSVQLPEGLKELGASAFLDCRSLTSIQLPENLQSIGGSAFSYCSSLTSIQLPENLQSIGESAFSYCSSLTSIQLPENLQSIEGQTFAYCENLTSASIPGGTISNGCFSQCRALKTIHIGARVNYIGSSCFESCTSLKEIHFSNFPLQPCADAFKNLYSEDMTLYVPKDTKKLYAAEDVWKDFKEIIEVDSVEVPKMEFVDLGLSVKWAATNIGAVSPGDYGYHYQWGNTSTSADYSLEYNKWYGGGYIKYCAADCKKELDSEDDVATYLYGNSCRMPTKAELDELISNCTTIWTSNNGVYGYKVTSKKNSNSIFLPAAGYRYGSSLSGAGSGGYYWSRSLGESDSYFAYYPYFDSGSFYRVSDYRCYGRSVRPVASE